jgi:hypothetical protein
MSDRQCRHEWVNKKVYEREFPNVKYGIEYTDTEALQKRECKKCGETQDVGVR